MVKDLEDFLAGIFHFVFTQQPVAFALVNCGISGTVTIFESTFVIILKLSLILY